jgi:hypothetical protein
MNLEFTPATNKWDVAATAVLICMLTNKDDARRRIWKLYLENDFIGLEHC